MKQRTRIGSTVAHGGRAVIVATALVGVAAGPTAPAGGEGQTCAGRQASITGSGTFGGTSGDDVIVGSPADDNIRGRGGNDIICGGAGRDGINGGDGRDRLYGNDGDDDLVGAPGDDRLRGGPGDDVVSGDGSDVLGTDDLGGGPGHDIAPYDSTERRVRVTLDGRRNDGRAGERDWIRHDVEGSRGTGTFIGNSRPNTFVAWGTVFARGGDDSITAGGGRFYGGAGDDSLGKQEEVEASAHFFGGPGDDRLNGTDWYWPSDGPDTNAVRDWLSCGSGNDFVIPGGDDIVRQDCERGRQ